MQVVIDIEEGRYNWIMSHASNHPNDYANTTDLVFRKAVESGIVLPKGHGDLIDRDKLFHIYRQMSLCSTAPKFIWVSELMKVTPVVEADKSEVD